MKPIKETEDITKPVKENLDMYTFMEIVLDWFYKTLMILTCLVLISSATQITKCVNRMAHSEYFDKFSIIYIQKKY